MFNVLYALKDQKSCLEQLSRVAKDNAVLMIFDYTCSDESSESDLADLTGKPMRPIKSDSLHKCLKETGWEIIDEIDLSEKYINWYSDFLKSMEAKKSSLLEEFTEEAYDTVKNVFGNILKELNEKKLGGKVYFSSYNKFDSISKNNETVGGDGSNNNLTSRLHSRL